jgi:hypothetical protein
LLVDLATGVGVFEREFGHGSAKGTSSVLLIG